MPDEPLAPLGVDCLGESSIEIELVFDAKIAPSGATLVDLGQSADFTVGVLEDGLDHEVGVATCLEVVGREDPGEDGVALDRRSDGPSRRPARGCRRCARGRPRRARSRARRASTCLPIAAWTWPMPWPINPAPATKTRSMGCAMASMVRGRPSFDATDAGQSHRAPGPVSGRSRRRRGRRRHRSHAGHRDRRGRFIRVVMAIGAVRSVAVAAAMVRIVAMGGAGGHSLAAGAATAGGRVGVAGCRVRIRRARMRRRGGRRPCCGPRRLDEPRPDARWGPRVAAARASGRRRIRRDR